MIIEATLIGILCYLGALSSPRLLGLTGGWYLITRPLVSGMLVGIILGDLKTGIMIGVAVQAVYIAMVTPAAQCLPISTLSLTRQSRWVSSQEKARRWRWLWQRPSVSLEPFCLMP